MKRGPQRIRQLVAQGFRLVQRSEAGSYVGYTDRDSSLLGAAAPDPIPSFHLAQLVSWVLTCPLGRFASISGHGRRGSPISRWNVQLLKRMMGRKKLRSTTSMFCDCREKLNGIVWEIVQPLLSAGPCGAGVRKWPELANVGTATSRQLSRVHRPSIQCGRHDSS